MVVATMETIPCEVLNRIFEYASAEDVDIALLFTSQSILCRLQENPVVRAMQALIAANNCIEIFGRHVCAFDHEHDLLNCPWLVSNSEHHTAGTCNDITTKSWCNAGFVCRLQIALIKRVLESYWYPLLAREGFPQCEKACCRVWQELDVFCHSEDLLVKSPKIESHFETGDGRYLWIRLSIWPREGRVVIRDQLCNRSVEIGVPLLCNYLELKDKREIFLNPL